MPSSRDPQGTEAQPDMLAVDELMLLARRLPKAEMHMHHMGSLAPSERARLYRAKHGAPMTHEQLVSAYDLRGVGKFFDDLDEACRLWGDAGAVTTGVLHMLCGAYDRGVRHVELLCTPDLHRSEIGMEPEVLLTAVGEAFKVAADMFGLTGGIVVELHRFDGGDVAVQLVKDTAGLRDKGVPILGYGNDGDHRTVPFEELAPAYELARAEGYLLTGHADELPDVGVALDLGLDRIDHGWMVVDEPATLTRLQAAGTALTFTPSGYSYGGLVGEHTYVEAWTMLSEAGVPLAIGTDDPELHHTDLSREYALLATHLDWAPADLAAAAKASFRASWLAGAEGEAVRQAWFDEIDALVADPRSPVR